MADADDGLSTVLKVVLILAFLPAAIVTLGVGGCITRATGDTHAIYLVLAVLGFLAVCRVWQGYKTDE